MPTHPLNKLDTSNKAGVCCSRLTGNALPNNPLHPLNIPEIFVRFVNLTPFGAFVELEPGIEGLVHLSQICERKITRPEDELRIGQKVNAKIIDMDLANKKIELSIRELENTSNEYKE